MEELISNSVKDVTLIANKILAYGGKEKVFVFFGSMGVGKTTTIKEIVAILGSEDEGNSPTFPIVNEYKSRDGESIFHFDFYRINSEEEAFDLGYEEYLYSGNYCFIEWPENILNLLPQSYVRVTIDEHEGKRILTLEKSI